MILKFYQAKGENIKQYIEFNPSIAAKEEQFYFVGNQYPSYNTLTGEFIGTQQEIQYQNNI